MPDLVLVIAVRAYPLQLLFREEVHSISYRALCDPPLFYFELVGQGQGVLQRLSCRVEHLPLISS